MKYFYRIKVLVQESGNEVKLIESQDFKDENLLVAGKNASSNLFEIMNRICSPDLSIKNHQFVHKYFVEVDDVGHEKELVIEGPGLDRTIENRRFELTILKKLGFKTDKYTFN